jgi:D-xylose 1-dehydrogenase (NADP+, D-xylono-1,5-lactone-forming)
MLNINRGIKRRRRLKWGVAGLGRFSENTMVPSLLQLRKSNVISLFSNDPTRAKIISEKNGIAEFYSNYDEFLKSDIDTVYIGSANYHHYDQVIKAAAAGKNILCEKPLAMDSAQAEEMVDACKKAGVRLAINYPYRFHPLVIKAKEFINEKMIGKLVSINLNFNIDLPPGGSFRYNIEKSGGGSLRDIGTHMIDLLRFFGGEINDITGYIDNIIYRGEVDDFAAALIKFNSGGYGYFNVSFNSKRAFNRIEILGHSGAIAIDSLIASKIHPAKITIMVNGEAKKAFKKKSNKLMNLLKSVQDSFLKNEEPLITGYDGLINLKLMEELERKCLTEKK